LQPGKLKFLNVAYNEFPRAKQNRIGREIVTEKEEKIV
jgi:hypothetical protein